MARRPEPIPQAKVTRDDLQRGFQALQDSARGQVGDRKSTLMTAAGVGGLLVIVIIFLLGKRSGKKKTTFVEIRRV